MYRYAFLYLCLIIFSIYTANTITGKLSRHSRNVGDCTRCSTNAYCVPSSTGTACICKSGYDGDGETCTDIDECSRQTDECHVEASCVNTDGSYECICNSGFHGDGYDCLGLSVDCQTELINRVTITFIGEAKMIYGKNVTGELCPFTSHDDLITHTLVVKYTQDDINDCLLKKLHIGQNTYSMTIVTRKSKTILHTKEDDMFEVTCSHDNRNRNASNVLDTDPSITPAVFVRHDLSKPAQSNFTLHLTKFNGDVLTSSTFGKLVKLKASMSPVGNETGFSVTTCMVQTLNGSHVFSILSNGCGTGYPIPTDKGFYINGTDGYSPTFRLFRITINGGVMFKCDFVICDDCDDRSTCRTDNR